MTIELVQKAVTDVAAAQKAHAAKLSESLEEVKTHQLELADRLVSLEQKGFMPQNVEPTRPASPLASFIQSDQLKAVLNGAPSTGRVEVKTTLPALRKSLLSYQGAQTNTNQYNVQAQRDDGLYNAPRLSLSLLDLLPRIRVASNTFEYIRLHSSFSHAAAIQAYESDAKAEQSVPTTTVTAAIATIATWIRASRQVLADAPMLERQIGDLISYGCLKKLEAEIVAGTGSISGLWTSGTALTTTGAQADRLSSAISQMIASGWNPDLIVMNPTDWHEIRTERGTSNDGYVAGGWNQPAAPNVWGLPVVITPSLTANNALVIDRAQVAILDREAPQVMVSSEDGSNFTSNLITILAELRAGLAIFSAGGVGKVTLSP